MGEAIQKVVDEVAQMIIMDIINKADKGFHTETIQSGAVLLTSIRKRGI